MHEVSEKFPFLDQRSGVESRQDRSLLLRNRKPLLDDGIGGEGQIHLLEQLGNPFA